jgi:hypothetical protein
MAAAELRIGGRARPAAGLASRGVRMLGHHAASVFRRLRPEGAEFCRRECPVSAPKRLPGTISA